MHDMYSMVQNDMKWWPFVVTNEGDCPKVKVVYLYRRDQTIFAEEISSMVLTKMKETAEAYLGKMPPNSPMLLSLFQLIYIFFLMIPRGR